MARRVGNAAPDQKSRDDAVTERHRNLIVDAGAGTGKTTILVDRLVEMLAPTCPHDALPIGRIAAITFTRKAAGELRLRIRERLLEDLAEERPNSGRAQQLRDALAGLDTAYVGTIHSFADRLLRLRPVEVEISPSYEIAEDEGPLIRETFEVLMHAVESGTLAAELVGSDAAARGDEATRTILDALAAGVQAESRETEWHIYYGLDALIDGFIRQRDVPPPDTPAAPFDIGPFREAAEEMIRLCGAVPGIDAPGVHWLTRTARSLRVLHGESDPVVVLRELVRIVQSEPRDSSKSRAFANHDGAYDVWKAWDGDDRRRRLRDGPLRDDLRAPLDRWMATRLVRLFPVIVALYERVKARRRQLDQLDLLVKLRELLARNLAVRGEFQRMFAHVFVDEFQDTDPLQAEIALYLCEREPHAGRWDEIEIADGKLTLVGDPKQSIYRFRRADVAMYDRVCGVVARREHVTAKLTANFRSVAPLIEWFNDRFARILGVSPDGLTFDPATGRVFQQRLDAARGADASPPVHVLPFDFADGDRHSVDEYRELEGRVLARYLRWLVESSGARIVDPIDGRPRPVRYGDIAVLAVSTWRLSLLFPRFDDEGIPYASRGGTLFLEDQLHRQFLLGLRAIADRDDGVAQAALLRPPFFGIDLHDLVRERAAAKDGLEPDEGALCAREARELVRNLRRRRFERPPGATARDLLEQTAFARVVALGPNGTQRLARLRELCLVFEQIAVNEGLDFDAATMHVRKWIDRPVQIDPPYPVGTEAVQILTVHQAKGLEFPIVAIWDGKGRWDIRPESGAWRMEREGGGWMLDLDGLTWEEPEGLNIRLTERAYLDAERRRVVYVAATRARDLLIVPKAGDVPPGKFVCGDLIAQMPADLVRRSIRMMEPYIEGHEPAWARVERKQADTEPPDGAGVEREVNEWWSRVSAEAARSRLRPASVSGEAQRAAREDAEELTDVGPRKLRVGRFGDLFGTTVHHAIAMVLRDGLGADEATRRAAALTGLSEHLEDAIGDVTRALGALEVEGLARSVGSDLQLEYPVAAAREGGQLLTGHIDLVAVTDGRIDVIDFKTDAPPEGSVEEEYSQYATQVRTYSHLLERTGIVGGRSLRCGLLFTCDGVIRWLDMREDVSITPMTLYPSRG
jgi:ATP-dependent exoDNAse (exonuclease V) beta subunit